MKRILVPLDGSEFAERALRPAMHLAARAGAELHLASVVSDLPPVPLASGDGDLVARWFDDEKDRAAEYLNGVQERLAAEGGGGRIAAHVKVGPVTRTLEGICEEFGIDLVILTTHGRGAWQRAWLGSIADQLLRSATVPLLLLREAPAGKEIFSEPSTPRNVLVPLDGSEAAEGVLAPLRAIVPTAGARLTLVSVLHQPFPLATTYLPHAVTEEALVKERKEQASEYLNGVEGRLREGGIAVVESRVVVGEDPARAVLDLAESEGADLIALSTRGRGGVSRFLLGSVADKLIRGAAVPLLIARRD